ncbi:MAG: hypothetical protein ACRDTK_00315 [Mycobacterium sp.]
MDYPFGAITINRGALSDDPAVQAIIAKELNIVGQRLINQLAAEGYLRGAAEIAVEGWLAFVRAACVKWIQLRNISRADRTEMCLHPFDWALGTPSRLSGGVSGKIHWEARIYTGQATDRTRELAHLHQPIGLRPAQQSRMRHAVKPHRFRLPLLAAARPQPPHE